MLGVSDLTFSRDGGVLAGCTQSEIEVWNVTDGQSVYRFPIENGPGLGALSSFSFYDVPLAVSGSGRLLAWSAYGKIEVRDLANQGQQVPVPAIGGPVGSENKISALVFSGDERQLIVLSESPAAAVQSIDLGTGQVRQLKNFETGTSPYNRAYPGRLLAVAASGQILVTATILDSARLRKGQQGGSGKIYDVTSGGTFQVDSPDYQAVSMGQGGQLVAASAQSRLDVWDFRSKHKLFSFAPDAGDPMIGGHWAADFNGDGTKLAVGDNRGNIHILDAHTGKEQTMLVGHANMAGLPFFDATGQKLYSGSKSIWDLKSGIALRTVAGPVSRLSQVSPDGKIYAEDAGGGSVKIWDLATQKPIATIPSHDHVLQSMSFSADSSLLASVRYEQQAKAESQERQIERAKRIRQDYTKALKSGSAPASAGIYRSGDPEVTVNVYDARTGVQKFALAGATTPISTVAFAPDRTRIAGATSDAIYIWNAADGKLVNSVPLSSAVSSNPFAGGIGFSQVMSLAFSPDGRSLAAGMLASTVSFSGFAMPQIPPMLNRGSVSVPGIGLPKVHRRKLPPIAIPVAAMMPTPTVTFTGPVMLFDTRSSRPAATLNAHANGTWGVAFSADGRLLATAGADGCIRIWDAASGSLRNEIANAGNAHLLAFHPGGKVLASVHSDGTIGLWDVQSGERLATLVSLYDGADWLVVTPEGLFDGSPAAWNQILWRYARNTFDVSPVESFFNEFFYPGLLADIVAGKHPKPPQQIADKDRRQPTVKLNSHAGTDAVADREIAVTIEVTESPAGQGRGTGSGAKDLRLFRNGSLVKVWHGDLLSGHSSARFTAKVPIVAGKNSLLAYVFNGDNVKSLDSEITVVGAPKLRRTPTTYLLAVGVDRYENPEYNLRFAVADAQSLEKAIQAEQAKAGKVEIIPLFNEAATRSGILEAISKLASITQPEDHVVLFFASHGTLDRDRFYLLPFDMGFKGKREDLDEAGVKQILSHGISDRDLEQALSSLDAAEVVVIIDACNSGQALEAEENRRGPMNSRGLAQLAYEKGMYVLTAAQSYQSALEVSMLGHGLLTYSLISEGLEQRKADDDPRDGRIFDREWLSFATTQVPELQMETLTPSKSAGRGTSTEQGGQVSLARDGIQRPKLFYRRELSSSPWMIVEAPGDSPANTVSQR